MSSVPPEKRCTTFLRFATSETASATPDDHGPTIKRAPSPSTASSARRVDVPACVAVPRDVPDRPAEDLHVALLERHPHAAVVERPDVREGAGLIPQSEDHDFLRLRAQDRGKAPGRGRQRSDLEDVPALELAHCRSPFRRRWRLDYL